MSNNGWPNDPQVITVKSGNDTAEVRAGDVAVILKHLGDSFHKYVEPVVTFNGYRSRALNTASGGIETSNHRSATAVDINGYEHPYEATQPASNKYGNFKHGFTDKQVLAIRNILHFFEGVLEWGQDFNYGYRDPMHFEINVGPTNPAVARVAAKIRRLTAPPPVEPTAPTPPPVVEIPEPPRKKPAVDLELVIRSLFRHYLKRDAAPADIDHWVSFFAEVDGSLSKLWSAIAQSPEAISKR